MITVAAFEPTTGYADPIATVYGFARAAKNLGVTFALETDATAILTRGGKVTGVDTTRGQIATAAVVLAAGAFANVLLQPLGIDLGLLPRRIQVAVFRWPWEMDQGRPHRVVIDSIHHSWMRPRRSFHIDWRGTQSNAAGRPGYLSGIGRSSVCGSSSQRLSARFPIFERAVMRGSWSGVVMQSPDDHPIIDHIPSVSGLFVSTGDSGSSFKTAPAVGRCLSEWIVAGEPQLMDLTPFRSTRFEEGRPWVDEHAYIWALDRRYPDEPGLSTAHRIPGLGTAAVAGSCHASGLCLSDCDSRRSVDSRRQWEPAVARGPRALPWFDAPLSMGAEDDLTARLAGTGRTISDIDLLVATHFDFDHSGNTDLFDDSGIQCFVQAALLDDAMAGDRSEPGLWNRPGVRYVSVTGDYARARNYAP